MEHKFQQGDVVCLKSRIYNRREDNSGYVEPCMIVQSIDEDGDIVCLYFNPLIFNFETFTFHEIQLIKAD